MTARRQNPPAKSAAISRLGLSLLFLGLAAPVYAVNAVPFLAHRAVYDLSLDADPSRPSVDGARGRIVFEFSGSACEGYTQNFRQVAVLDGAEFGQRRIDSRSLSFEEADGKVMRYSGSLTINDGEPQDTEGTVEIKDDALSVNLTKPAAEAVTLKGQAEFPTAHYQNIVAAAVKGATTLEARVFDGSGDGKTVSDSFAIIGKLLTQDKASEAVKKAGFAGMKRWPVIVSYFDGEGQEREFPSYSMSMELLENGVADALVLNYGDFVLKGTLRQIDLLPQRSCP
jgi:hypothetical protein